MKAVVMAGGEGSRLRPLTSRRPKPLVPVAGAPIMEHILTLLRDHGFTEVVVTLQYLGAEIRNYFNDGSDFGMSIEYVVEDLPLGTAGSVGNAAHLLRDDTVLVISGDALTDIDLSWVLAEHRRRGAQATLVLHSVPNPLEYGVVVTDGDGAVRRFLEKPSWGEVFSDQANTGIYCVEPRVLDLISAGVPVDWSQHVFPEMLRRGDPLFGIVAGGYWCDVGTIQSYLQANWDVLTGRVRCRISGTQTQENVWVGDDVEFGIDVRIDGPVWVGDEAKIKAGAWLNGHVVVDKYSVVDDNAKLSNSIVWQHSYLGESARLRQTIVGRHVTVKNNVLLDEGTVVGDDCVIGPGTHVHADVKIWPGKEVQGGSTVHESIIWAGEWRRGLFSSYGLGGLINVELTPEWCSRLGAAFAATLPKGSTIAVTRDAVRASRMIKRALIAGMMSAGGNVRDLSELAVPVTQFATRAHSCAAGVHVLVSPMDRRSADIRFFDGEGLPLDKRGERKVENLFFREDFRRVGFYEMGDIEYANPTPDYIAHVVANVDAEAIRNAGLRVLIDYDYSAASPVLPEILNQLGVTAIPLHTGFSESHMPKPLEQFQSMLDEAALITRTLGADLGCAISASGERIAIIDESGTVLDKQQAVGVFVILALDLGGGTVRAPAVAPHWLAPLAAEHGGTLVATKGDQSSILRAGLEPGTRFACDSDGGFMWPAHLGAFDAMETLVRLLELRARSARPISAVRKQLPQGVYLERLEFCPWELKGRVMRVLLERHHDGELDLADGIKVCIDGGYVLVLPDADQPYYRVVVSVDGDEERANRLLDDYATEVREAQQGRSDRMLAASILDR